MTTRDDHDDLVELAAGRGGLVACALALLITTCLPVTRWSGDSDVDNDTTWLDEAQPVPDLDLWGITGTGDISGALVAVPLVLLAVMCLASRVGPVLRYTGAIAALVTLWAGLYAAFGFEGDLLAARWLCLVVPAVTTVVAARAHTLNERVFG